VTPPSMRKSLPVMKGAVGAHEECRQCGDLVGCAGAADGAVLDHAPVPLAAGSGEFVDGQRRDDDARADGVDPGAALTSHGVA